MLRRIAAVLVFDLLSHILCAQDFIRDNFMVRQFSSAEGYQHSGITHITQDELGIMWFGSSRGLASFDGYKFHHYNYDPNDRNSMAPGWITSLHADQNGLIWFTTIPQYGTQVLNTKTGKLLRYLPNSNDSLLSDALRMTIDKNGNTWIRSLNHSIVKIDSRDQPIHRFFPQQFCECNFEIRDLALDHSDKLWVLSEDHLIALEPESKGSTCFKVPDTSQRELRHYWKLVPDHSGNIWLLYNNSVYQFNHHTKEFKPYRKILEDIGLSRETVLTDIIVDSRNRLWAVDRSGNFFVVYINSDKTFKFRFEPDVKKEKSDYCIYEDRTMNIWIGHDSTILLLQPKPFPIHSIDVTSSFQSSLASKTMDIGVYLGFEENENIWFYTATSIGYFNIHDHRVHNLNIHLPEHIQFEDREGAMLKVNKQLFISDYKGNAFLVDVANGNLSPLPGDSIRAKSPLTIIHCFAKIDSAIWFSTRAGRLIILNPQPGTLSFLPPLNEESVACPSTFPEAIFNDSNGRIWLGTGELGLYRYDPNKKMMLHVGGIIPDSADLDKLYIAHIDEDSTGHLWIATHNHGLLRYDPGSGDLKEFPVSENNGVNCVKYFVTDRFRNYWLLTHFGVMWFHPPAKNSPSDHELLNRSYDFMSDDYGSAIAGSDGAIYLGGGKGVVYFFPDSSKPQSARSDIIFTGFNVDASPFEMDSAIGYKKNICIPAEKNNIEIEYASPDYLNQDLKHYYYRLVGFDKDWVDAGAKNHISYNNLSPGTYEFQVGIASVDGVLSDKTASINIRLITKLRKRWWFIVLESMAAITLVVFVTRFFTQLRLKQRLAVLERKTAVETERQRISRDMHDELGSGLSRISLMTELLKTKAGHEPITEGLDRIANASREISDQLHEIVWTLNPQNDSLKNLIIHLRQYAIQFFENSSIELTVTTPEIFPSQEVNGIVRRNIFLSVKESLTNIAKHSNAKKAGLSMLLHHSQFEIRVSDDGKGIEVSEKNLGGSGVENMKRRMDEIHGRFEMITRNGEGMELVFLISLSKMSP
ncbi:MAG TPA: triple tyrosine motif-containing protein [Chitinophagales bacterium]|nr:triple tyrosine motif-containing protein [Chitinophagales bacterium]